MTGHDNGLVTIALTEADDAERERRRAQMHEPYRTLLGHFRHEVGHHSGTCWCGNSGWLDQCRAPVRRRAGRLRRGALPHYAEQRARRLAEALRQRHTRPRIRGRIARKRRPLPAFVDTLEMVAASGMWVKPKVDKTGDFAARVNFDPYEAKSIEQIVDAWLPYVFAINNVSRAMGERNMYSFVLSPSVIGKLGFIHGLVHGLQTKGQAGGRPLAQSVQDERRYSRPAVRRRRSASRWAG